MLVGVAIIAILMAMLLPAIAVVRERVRTARAEAQVAAIHQALQHYAAEDARHRYPPPHADLSLRLDPAGAAPGNLDLLRQQGLEIDRDGLERSGAPPHPLCDPWQRPYRYQVDADLLASTGAQRPRPAEVCPAWNAAGVRPWAYVWSLGRHGRDDGREWIYVRSDR